jgi:hypothetical protein
MRRLPCYACHKDFMIALGANDGKGFAAIELTMPNM